MQFLLSNELGENFIIYGVPLKRSLTHKRISIYWLLSCEVNLLSSGRFRLFWISTLNDRKTEIKQKWLSSQQIINF